MPNLVGPCGLNLLGGGRGRLPLPKTPPNNEVGPDGFSKERKPSISDVASPSVCMYSHLEHNYNKMANEKLPNGVFLKILLFTLLYD